MRMMMRGLFVTVGKDWGALHYAAAANNVKLMSLVMYYDGDLELRTGDQETALIVAAKRRMFQVCVPTHRLRCPDMLCKCKISSLEVRYQP
jgi:hypothetical protein